MSQRGFKRYKIEIKIGLEFVKWNETELKMGGNPQFTRSLDISQSGIGLENIQGMNKKLLKQLLLGKKKIRLGLYINGEAPPTTTFARLIWSNPTYKEEDFRNRRYGCMFLDISLLTFNKLKDLLDSYTKSDTIL